MKIQETDKDLAMNLFCVLAWTAVIANTIGTIANGIFYGLNQETIMNIVCTATVYIAAIIGVWRQKPKGAAAAILGVCAIFEFPVMYLIYGADRLGYMFLGLVGVVLFIGKKWRKVMSVCLIVYDSAIIMWREYYSINNIIAVSGDTAVATLMDFVISAVSISVMLIILLARYEEQHRRLENMTVELQNIANKDPLTCLYNRRYLTDYIEEKIKKGDESFTVALLDIDDFKAINDKYGHIYGDETLQAFTGYMREAMNEKGIAARYGGEEFMLVFDNTGKTEIDRILMDIKQKFNKYGMDTKKQNMSFSGGVATFCHGYGITELFNEADKKLYEAKNRGKNCVVYE